MLFTAASALAGTSTFANGWVPYGGDIGPWHTLSATAVSSWNGDEDCANAMNAQYQAVGLGYCTFGYISHPYCACALRYGWVYAYWNGGDYMTGTESY
jgi:hypothetical protein